MALSEAKKAADKRHRDKLDNIMIRPYKEEGTAIRTAAAAAGMSVQRYILEAVRDKMEHEQAGVIHDHLSAGNAGTEDTGKQRWAGDSDDAVGDISICSDDTPTPQTEAAVFSTRDEKPSPSKLSPDDWAEWARRQDDESLEDWKARLKKSNVGTSPVDIMKRIGKLPKEDRNIILEIDPV